MDKNKSRDHFYLRRGDVREWVFGEQLAHLPHTSNELSLSGMIFRCDRLATFFYGESGQDLRALAPIPPDLSEVIIEVWHTDNKRLYTFEHIFRLYNVSVVNFKHTGDCACCCGGEVTIKFDKIEICEANKRQIDLIDENCWLKPEYMKEYSENT